MRHIPDEELHAYLDQALSRSQCVEIECHLASCLVCGAQRDEIAALRDRTTALLGMLAPRVLVPPPLATLAARTPRRRPVLVRWHRSFGWAASIAAALLTGLALHSYLDRQAPGSNGMMAREEAPLVTAAPTIPEAPVITVLPIAPMALQASGPANRSASPTVRLADNGGAPRLDVAPLGRDGDGDFEFDGMWKTVSWDEAEAITQKNVPRVEGLPVLEVRVQQIGPAERPIVIVTQQHPSGAVIRTVEGPVTDIVDLVTRQTERVAAPLYTSTPTRSPVDYIVNENGVPERGIRVMTVTGRLSPDTLEALSHRLTFR